MIYLRDPDFTLHQGDALDVLRELPDESVDCCATSPPFYGLRDYGTGTWEGGNEECDHRMPATGGNPVQGPNKGNNNAEAAPFKSICGKCGARRIDRQIGLEATPDEWVARLVEVFREVRRVLRRDGTFWLECGDSYASAWPCSRRNVIGEGSLADGKRASRPPRLGGDLKDKDLMLNPFLLAFALRADGWYLRQAIVWHKPNAMPESVRDRCTTAHSYVFLLSKSPRYFFDAEAISEPAEWARWGDQTVPKHEGTDTAAGWIQPASRAELVARGGRTTNGQRERTDEMRGFDNRMDRVDGRKNARSVWTIPTQSFAEAHFATFPEALIERIIKAGCPERVCRECGKARERVVDRGENIYPGSSHDHAQDLARGGTGAAVAGQKNKDGVPAGTIMASRWYRRQATALGTLGFTDCGHGAYRPGIVLDPFLGSGTTALVARKQARSCVGIELNEDYCAMAARRLQQLSLLAETP